MIDFLRYLESLHFLFLLLETAAYPEIGDANF